MEEHIEVEGRVQTVLPGTMFRVQLANGHMVLAHISGKLRKHFIKIAAGDMVKMEMSPYDLEKARRSWNRAWIVNGPSTMWRYQPVLPVKRPESIVSLGDPPGGGTPPEFVAEDGYATRFRGARLMKWRARVRKLNSSRARSLSITSKFWNGRRPKW